MLIVTQNEIRLNRKCLVKGMNSHLTSQIVTRMSSVSIRLTLLQLISLNSVSNERTNFSRLKEGESSLWSSVQRTGEPKKKKKYN